MTGVTRSPSEAEVDAFVRALRPSRTRVIVVVAIIVVATIACITAMVAHELSRTNGSRPVTSQPSTPAPHVVPAFAPFIVVPAGRSTSPFAAGRQAVAVQTLNSGADGSYGSGSGFLLTDGFVVSAAHILTAVPGSEKAPVSVVCNDVERFGTVQAFDPVRDVTTILAPECRALSLVLRTDEVTADDALHVSGYNFASAEDEPSLTCSWFANESSFMPAVHPNPDRDGIKPALLRTLLEMKRENVTPLIAIAGAFVPGNSGSAVYDDDGRIVGMLVAVDPRRNRSYLVPTSTIVDVLTRNGTRIVH